MVDTKLFKARVLTHEEACQEIQQQRNRYYYPEDTKAMENRKRVFKHYKKYGLTEGRDMVIDGERFEVSKTWNKFISGKGKDKICFTCKNHKGTYKLFWVKVEELFRDVFTLDIDMKPTEAVIGDYKWYGIEMRYAGSKDNIDVVLTGLTMEKRFNDSYMFNSKENRDKMYKWVVDKYNRQNN